MKNTLSIAEFRVHMLCVAWQGHQKSTVLREQQQSNAFKRGGEREGTLVYTTVITNKVKRIPTKTATGHTQMYDC